MKHGVSVTCNQLLLHPITLTITTLARGQQQQSPTSMFPLCSHHVSIMFSLYPNHVPIIFSPVRLVHRRKSDCFLSIFFFERRAVLSVRRQKWNGKQTCKETIYEGKNAEQKIYNLNKQNSQRGVTGHTGKHRRTWNFVVHCRLETFYRLMDG